MANKKVTMVIKVDLNCQKCREKTKKILCEIPQIQNQIYDAKANTVTITVVCCSPEKIKKKIYCKGGDSIKGIEIEEPDKTGPPPDETKDPKKIKVVVVVEQPKPPAACPGKPEEPPNPPAACTKKPDPVPACCRECYEGHGGGPCYERCRRPVPCCEGYGTPAPCYGAYGRPVYHGSGGGYYGDCRRGCYVGRCDCLSEENPSACSVM